MRRYDTVKAISRSSRLVAALAATTGLLLAGCSTGAGQPNAAVIIGDKVIPVSDVQHKLDAGVAVRADYQQLRDQHKLDQAGRAILSVLIRQELAGRLAQREGVPVSDSAVDAVMARIGGTVPDDAFPAYDLQGVRDLVRSQLEAEAVGKKYATRTAVTFDAVFATTRAEAMAKAKQMAKGEEAIRQLVKDETAKKQQATLGTTLNFAQAKASYAVSPLFGTAAGTIVAFPVADDSGQLEQQTTPTSQWMVAHVRSRNTGAPAPANPAGGQQTPEGMSQLYVPLGLSMISMLGDELGMQVNPRYGVWDLVKTQLVPSTGEKAAFQIKAGTTAS
ncbi:hypothetical protein [Allokutzneria oryzae]|uniref:SurA N-terminal domain-containing protein n=1 Tax=Allokutzneria oryzae TaxID=1378989 RepID=A0ABV6A215_9PSEU